MKTYQNGEPITKDRIQDEVWYSDYQAMLEIAVDESNKEDVVFFFNVDYEYIFGREYPDQTQLNRWADSLDFNYEFRRVKDTTNCRNYEVGG